VNTTQADAMSCISQDGLTLYFASDRPGGIGSKDLWVTTRARKDQPWAEPENLGSPVNSLADEVYPSISADGLQLYFSEWGVFRPGGHGDCDIWVATRPTKDTPWGQPANLGLSVNTPAGEIGPFIPPDGSALYFCSNRPGGYGRWDIWQAPVLHWPDDVDAPGGADQAEILPKGSEGKEVVPDAKH
jgi:Tol biopolymer transport system component